MKTIIAALLIISAVVSVQALPATAASQTTEEVFSACKQAPSSTICKGKDTTTNPVYHIVKVAADIVALLTGVAAVIVIIISGITLIGSGGNTEAATIARRRLTAAVIGLVVVALAWTIISYVITQLIKT